jgi:FixJ family two-component response regulator
MNLVHPGHQAASQPRPISVAIIDDEPCVRSSLQRLCAVLGLYPSVYSSGKAFLDALTEQQPRPDCLMLDAQMPEMTGLEVHQRLVQLGIHIPTVVFTAAEAPEVRARYLAAGVAEYLRKPVAGDDLLAAIERAVKRGSAAASAD